jgi:hypothetical protein
MVDASDLEGAVDRHTVIRVLKASGVVISNQKNGPAGMLVLAKNGYFESRRIPEVVHKRMLNVFKRKFDIPIEHFFNPHLIIQGQIQ